MSRTITPGWYSNGKTWQAQASVSCSAPVSGSVRKACSRLFGIRSQTVEMSKTGCESDTVAKP